MGQRRRRKKILERLPVVCVVEHMSHDGRAIARLEGKTAFVSDALAGEKIEARYTASHRRYDELQTLSVIEAAEGRVAPKCPVFGVCGGCRLQHADEAYQLTMKQGILQEHLDHHLGEAAQSIAMMPPLQGPQWGYRRKARLSVRWVEKKASVLVGFRERNGRYVVAMEACPVLDPRVGCLIQPLRDLIGSMCEKSSIAQVEVACADEVALVLRHLSPLPESDLTLLKSFADDHGVKWYLQPSDEASVHLFYPKKADFLQAYRLDAWGLDYAFHPSAFIQVNAVMNQKMIQQALDWMALKPTDTVLDLFCGLGNFSLPMAQAAHQVVGVEGSDQAVKQAALNAQKNGIGNTVFYAADLAQPLEGASWVNQTYDVVLLDPPRTGAAEIIPYMKQWAPSRILYVSCHALTMAQDAVLLKEAGYRMVQAGIMDMFPQTAHMECMAMWVKGA